MTGLLANCYTCGCPNVVDAEHATLTALGDHLAILWDCTWCGEGIAPIPAKLGRQVLTCGIRIDDSARRLAARTHGPQL